MLQFRTGNLFDSSMQTLVNAVNVVGVMGKGVALQFKERYPAMYEAYQAKCQKGELKLGTLHLFKADDHWILNFPTKGHYRAKSKLADIEAGLIRLRDSYQQLGIVSLALPALGCGYGGLDWQEVRPLIERYLGGLPIPIEVYEPGGKKEQNTTQLAGTQDHTDPASPQLSLLDFE